MNQCPSWQNSLPAHAVLCVKCGFHLGQQSHLATVVDPKEESSRTDANPYRSPAESGHPRRGDARLRQTYDIATRVEYLEERVRELERRIDATRLLAPGFFTRMFTIWGYVLCIVAIPFALVLLGSLLLGGISESMR